MLGEIGSTVVVYVVLLAAAAWASVSHEYALQCWVGHLAGEASLIGCLVFGISSAVLTGVELVALVGSLYDEHERFAAQNAGWLAAGVLTPVMIAADCRSVGRFYRSTSAKIWREWLGSDEFSARLYAKRLVYVIRPAFYGLAAVAASVRLIMTILSRVDQGSADHQNAWLVLLEVAMVAIAGVLATKAVLLFSRMIAPQAELVRAALIDNDDARTEFSNLNADPLRPSRWRTIWHRPAFRVAAALEKCTPGFQHRLPPREFDELASISRRLADAIRHEGTSAKQHADAEFDRVERLFCASVALMADEFPMRVVDRIKSILINNYPDPPTQPVGRFVRLADSFSEHAQRYWSTVKIFLAIAAIAALVSTGNLTRVIDLIK